MTHFRQVPERAADLEAWLEDSRKIKVVYLHLRKLVRLRRKAYERASQAHHKELREYFDPVVQTAEKLQAKVWEHIEDMVEFAVNEPEVLVRTLEVVEMEDHAKMKVFDGLPVPGGPQGMLPDDQSKSQAGGAAQAQAQSLLVPGSTTPGGPGEESMRARLFAEVDLLITRTFLELKDGARPDEPVQVVPPSPAFLTPSTSRVDVPDMGVDMGGTGVDSARSSAVDHSNEPSTIHENEEEENEQSVSAVSGAGGTTAKSLAKEEDERIAAALEKMKEFVYDLLDFVQHGVQCFPPDYEIRTFVEDRFQKLLWVWFCELTVDTMSMTKRSLLRCVGWVLWYRGEMAKNGIEGRDFETQVDDLMERYLSQSRKRLLQLISNVVVQDLRSEAQVDEEGKFFTFGPQDIFSLLTRSIDAIIDKFQMQGRPLVLVAEMCADLLDSYQNALLGVLTRVKMRDQDIYVGELLKDDTFLCGLINNCYRCEYNVDDMLSTISERLEEMGEASQQQNDEAIEQLEERFEEVNNGFVDVGVQCTELLVLYILHTCDPDVNTLFTPEWLADEQNTVMATVSATVQDFADSYRKVLSRVSFFTKLIEATLEVLVATYVDKFLQRKPTITPEVITRLEGDQARVEACFARYGDVLSSETLVRHLRALELIREIVNEEQPIEWLDFLFEDISTVFADRGEQVLDGLLRMRRQNDGRRDVLQRYVAKYVAPKVAAEAARAASAASASRQQKHGAAKRKGAKEEKKPGARNFNVFRSWWKRRKQQQAQAQGQGDDPQRGAVE